jgi:hypothetical protein
MKNKIVLIILLAVIFVVIEGCTVKGYNYGNKIDKENYILQELYEMPYDNVRVEKFNVVTVTYLTGYSITGTVIKVRKYDSDMYDLIIKVNGRKIKIKYEDVKHLQVIYYPIESRCLYTSMGLVGDAAALYTVGILIAFGMFYLLFGNIR